ncbi:MAG: DUF3368 domain-containing protein [bacterium]|nr:DUF3368 domain-containing protein [bacterium]
MSVISNTTVLSNFAGIGALDLLRKLYGEIYLSTDVYQEIQRGLEEGYSFYAGIDAITHPRAEDGWLRLTTLTGQTEVELFSALPSQLHAGEASSLAIAQNRRWLFLTDDNAARKLALRREVALSGTLGCLAIGVERKLWALEEANRWLRGIIDSGFHSPVADLAELLKVPGPDQQS